MTNETAPTVEQVDRDGEGEPWAWGWYERGGTKRAHGYLPTVDYPSEPECEPFPLYRHPTPTPAAQASAMREALRLAVFHLKHLAGWVGKKQVSGEISGYSFEGLGEDLPGIEAILAAAPALAPATDDGGLREAAPDFNGRCHPEVERCAAAVYYTWRDQPGYVAWLEHGNSKKQDEAREVARAALSSKGEAA